MSLTAFLEAQISALPVIKPGYDNDSEKAINPCYRTIDQECPFQPNEKRIWVLRDNLILATGIKNDVQDAGNTTFQSQIAAGTVFDPGADRFGHPSLALTNEIGDAKAYYAGWLAQRPDHIQFFLQSGRFHRKDLILIQQIMIEIYIASKLMEKGDYPVIFYDLDDDAIMRNIMFGQFLDNRPFPIDTPKRVYPKELIVELNRLPDHLLNIGIIISFYINAQLDSNNLTEVTRTLTWLDKNDNYEFLRVLLKTFDGPGRDLRPFSSLLSLFNKKNDLEIVQLLLSKAHISQAEKNTALMEAASLGHNDMIRLLLENGAEVNPVRPENTHEGWTALHWAAAKGHKSTCELLLSQDAIIDAKNADGKTPVALATDKETKQFLKQRTPSCCSCLGFWSKSKPGPKPDSDEPHASIELS